MKSSLNDPQVTELLDALYVDMAKSDALTRNTFRRMILAVVILTPALVLVVLPSKSAKADTPQSATSKIVGGANAFLATLSEKQRSAVLYKFDDDEQRVRWSNFPTGFVPRGGLSLEELSDTQQKDALALVASTLSQKGFEKVEEIKGAGFIHQLFHG